MNRQQKPEIIEMAIGHMTVLIKVNSIFMGNRQWIVTVGFNEKEQSFVWEDQDDPKEDPYSFLQQLLTYYEDFGQDVPSFEAYSLSYFGTKNETLQAYYQRDILDRYASALDLFGEYTELVYETCMTNIVPRLKKWLSVG